MSESTQQQSEWDEHARRVQRRANWSHATPRIDRADKPARGRDADNLQRGRWTW